MGRLFHFVTRFRPVRFIISGGTAACIHISTVYFLTEIYDIWYLFATIAGFCLAVSVNFTLQKFWTFREKTARQVHRQTTLFFLVNGINLLLNGVLMVILVENMHLWPVLAQIAASGLIAIESFVLYTFIFRVVVPDALPLAGDNQIVETELKRLGTDVRTTESHAL